jgi:hypothetical protein
VRPGSSLLELKQRIGFYASLNPDALPLVMSTSVSPNKGPVLTVVKTSILFFAAVVLLFAARRH